MTKNKVLELALRIPLIGFSVFNMSCGAVKQAVADRDPVVADQLQDFAYPVHPDSIVLSSNQLFLWPDGITANDTAKVFDLSNQIDLGKKREQQLLTRSSVLGKQKDTQDQKVQDALKSDPEILAASTKVDAQKLEVNKLNSKLAKATADRNNLKNKQQQFQDKVDLQKKVANPDPGLLDQLKKDQAQLDSYTAKVNDMQNQLNKLDSDHTLAISLQSSLISDLEKLTSAAGQKNAALMTDKKQTEDELNTVQADIVGQESSGKGMIDQVVPLVDWYDMDGTNFTFKTNDDGSLYASVGHWKIGTKGVEMSFSTEPGAGGIRTIQNLKYTVHGGILDFDVLVFSDETTQKQLVETFTFHVSRNNYQSGSKTNCFLGDLFRKRTLPDGTLETRKGIVKLVDSNG